VIFAKKGLTFTVAAVLSRITGAEQMANALVQARVTIARKLPELTQVSRVAERALAHERARRGNTRGAVGARLAEAVVHKALASLARVAGHAQTRHRLVQCVLQAQAVVLANARRAQIDRYLAVLAGEAAVTGALVAGGGGHTHAVYAGIGGAEVGLAPVAGEGRRTEAGVGGGAGVVHAGGSVETGRRVEVAPVDGSFTAEAFNKFYFISPIIYIILATRSLN